MKYAPQTKELLDQLVAPFPFLMRAMAKKMIENQIFEEAKKAGHTEVHEEDVVKGYVIVGKNRGNDLDKIKSSLQDKVDLAKYEEFFAQA